MRLLHTTSLQIKHFIDRGSYRTLVGKEGDDMAESALPKYAILSHTWGEGEILFEDMQGDQGAARTKLGYAKLKDSCARAALDGFEYIWVDTCCIDKNSSSELSEAINSMFRWYKNSALCYVFLEDSFATTPFRTTEHNPTLPKWYSRGWTLQELIAPAVIHFYGFDWKFLGTKSQHLSELSSITGIDMYALSGGNLARISVGRRMSWISHRKTTRSEDMAYSMLGIFDISMPLLYGEGAKAFVRLQEEIMRSTDDQSLFVWREDDSTDYYREDYGDAWERAGLLAQSPAFFKSSSKISRFHRPRPERPQSAVTSQGLTVNFLMCLDTSYQSGEVYLAVLDCQIGRIPGVMAAIRLRRVSAAGNEFVRIDIPQVIQIARLNPDGTVDMNGFDPSKEQAELVDFTLRITHLSWTPRSVRVSQSPMLPLPPGFWLVPPHNLASEELVVMAAHPRHRWDSHSWIMQTIKSTIVTGKTGALQFRFSGKQYFLIFGMAATQHGMQPWFKLEQRNGPITLDQFFNHFQVDIGLTGKGNLTGLAAGPYNGASHWDTIEPSGLGVSLQQTIVSGHEMFLMQILCG